MLQEPHGEYQHQLASIRINMWLGGVGSLVSMIWVRNLAKFVEL